MSVRGARIRDTPVVIWHAIQGSEVLTHLQSGATGLTPGEAERRLARHGPNSLDLQPADPWWRVLSRQFQSLVVALLVVAAVGAVLLGEGLEALAIAAVLVIDVGLGFAVEWRARRAMEALRNLQVHSAVVLRGGVQVTVDSRGLVPGDVLLLHAGDAVPADARLLHAADLRMVEAALTGESLPVTKDPAPVPAETILAERTPMVFKGTLVAAGEARAVVTATGADTEIGRVGELVSRTRTGPTPLERRLDQLGRRLVLLTLGIATAVVALGIYRGERLWPMMETGLALAIAAVPEGLPVVATIALAVGMTRMARRRALVRRLPAVETLGSVTVLCTDKTGTLTAGEMTVTAVWVGGREWPVSGRGYGTDGALGEAQPEAWLEDPAASPERAREGLEELLAVAVTTNRAHLERSAEGTVRPRGDPTEAALLVLGAKAGLDRQTLVRDQPEVAEVPFSSERRWMATFHRQADRRGAAPADEPPAELVVRVKGAPERLLARASQWWGPGGPEPLDAAARRRLEEVNRQLAGRGLRVLALARRSLSSADGAAAGEEAVADLTFLGFVGFLDPPAEGVRETVATLRSAGVRTVMITGDQAITAEAVARDLGVLEETEETLDGRDLARLSPVELSERVERAGAYSRVSPADKLAIVEALQGRGEVVGMLGDGVNDAPALKKADIGVAMGIRGTDVAKETAAVVLQDDRFPTVVAAVEEGRVIFDNIRKFLFYLFSCNLSEVSVVFVTTLLGLPLALLPLQILWLNLVTDVFPALALAVEPAEEGVLTRPPRDPRAAILSRRFLLTLGGYSLLLTGSTLAVFLWALERAKLEEAHAVTLAFMTLALGQLAHVFNARSWRPVLVSRRLWSNRWVWGAIGLTVGLQLAAVYLPPLARVLETRPLRAEDWAVVAVASLVPLAVGQLWKGLVGDGLEERVEAQGSGAP